VLRVLEDLVARWGYVAVALGTFLEGEAVLLVGAAMAHRGLLSLPLVALSAVIGSVASDQLWFLLGRHAGRRWIAKHPRVATQVAVIERWVRRSGTLFVLGFRFLYGLRTLSPVVLGATGYPAGRFVLLNVIGAALWATVFSLGGYGLGAGIAALIGRASRLEEAALAAVAIALVLWLVARRRERSAAVRAQAEAPREG
jgi:membrane protein DedA with SNARE-associated domain